MTSAPVGLSPITALSNAVVTDLAALSPMTAAYLGIPGGETELDDLSPDGLAERNDVAVRARAGLVAAESTGVSDDVAREVVLERLDARIEEYGSGWATAALNVIASPLQDVRMVFDLVGKDTPEQQEQLAARIAAVPAALDGYRSSLLAAAASGKVSALRQVVKCAEQCAAYAGIDKDGATGYFADLATGIDAGNPALTRALSDAAARADAAYGELGEFLTRELAPLAPARDAVGEVRYAVQSRDFLGAAVDLAETYAWGWEEFLSVEREMHEVAERIAPGAGPAGAAAQLDRDERYLLHGVDNLQAWMQDMSDRAVAELGRSHFEIDAPIRELACRIAPSGGVSGAYYTGPSDDLTRPGTMWWSVEPGKDTFGTWRETTTVYHEGVPGHHLQIATAVVRRDRLNDFQRLFAMTSGHAEGWALYAERLVRELGYLDDDGDLLGLLDSQLFRSARVVIDIGMHLELEIPAGTGFHEGERWTPELGLEFLLTRTLTEPGYARDEIDRYLGWPGQAPAYKVGERVWRAGRADAERRHGAAFDLKHFHTEALALGGMGLAPLEKLLARI
ncbi:DUF885 family protein [Nakamurella sp. YIM 132087]|uniref:DUF885 family protein n=1 Tax=Nakamurella alba TaxID=2665158 RepID=A0A7K1FT12_9ACTN|nr:DUF885 domain-containing protein [Nakamurella alba]MTD16529.1 DUF885 family protein [Nakamurella alba]